MSDQQEMIVCGSIHSSELTSECIWLIQSFQHHFHLKEEERGREKERERERDVNQAHFKHASLFCLTADNNGLTLLE